jgi:integrase
MMKGYRIKPYTHPRLKWLVRGKESGNWVRRFFATKAEAETFAEQKNIELLNLGIQGAEFPIELRAMAQEAARELGAFGKTIREAKDFFIAHLLRVQNAASLSKVVDEVLTIKTAMGVKPRTLKTYRGYVKNFAAEFPDRDIGTLTADEIEGWLLRKFQNPVSRNNNRRVLVNLFNIAKKKKYIASNPVSEIATASEPANEVGILRPEQVAKLLNHSEPEILPYFALAAFAGIRPEELKKPAEMATENSELLWSDIKWKQGIIRIRAQVSKVGKARNIAIEPNLHDWLRPFQNLHGKVCSSTWLRLFRKTRRDAGIAKWPSDCLRHSFATYWLEKYKDAPRLALEMGNSVDVILNHYHKVLDDPTDAARYWSIAPSVGNQKVISFAGT